MSRPHRHRRHPQLVGNGVIETSYNRRQLRKHPTWDHPTPPEIRQRHDQGRLRVRAEPDTRRYLTGKNPAPLQVAVLALARDNLHGDWNHTLHPAPAPASAPEPPPGCRIRPDRRARRGSNSLIDQVADHWQMVAHRDLTRHTGRPRLRPSARGIGQLEYLHRVPTALLRARRAATTVLITEILDYHRRRGMRPG